jgi:magnesium-transporting ATPase (P-type)
VFLISIENALQNLSFIGMIDPLRPEVKGVVAQCKVANIKVAMITGDHPKTALVLAEQSVIADNTMRAVTEDELTAAFELNKEAFSQCVPSTKVFARISLHQKRLIMEQIMEGGDFVAVTGDGVNEAPVLNHVHVGIALGIT